MNLNRQIASQIYYGIGAIINKIANLFGYPDNPGMPTSSRFSEAEQLRLENLPMHEVRFPPEPVPNNIFEVLFGVIPKTETIKRVFYESPSEGYYNFYIQDFKNAYFLPDQLSEIIQVFFKVCLDTSGLEAVREVLFISLIAYYNILNLRLCMFWFLSINPYTYPWLFLVYLVDWTEDILQGLVPVVAGVNLTATFWFILIGKIADSLNHLVFTMPFLPSEAQRAQTIINGQVENVLLYRFLPILWFRKPIPNEIREFWYYNRPDIFKFMEKSYGHLDIKLLPDSITISDLEKETINSINFQQYGYNKLELKDQIFQQQIENDLNSRFILAYDNKTDDFIPKFFFDEKNNLDFIVYKNNDNSNVIDSNLMTESMSNYFNQIEKQINSSEFLRKDFPNFTISLEGSRYHFEEYFNINLKSVISDHFNLYAVILEKFKGQEHNIKMDSINSITDYLGTYILSNNNLSHISEVKNYLIELTYILISY